MDSIRSVIISKKKQMAPYIKTSWWHTTQISGATTGFQTSQNQSRALLRHQITRSSGDGGTAGMQQRLTHPLSLVHHYQCKRNRMVAGYSARHEKKVKECKRKMSTINGIVI